MLDTKKGIKSQLEDDSSVFALFKLMKWVSIGINSNAYMHWLCIFMQFTKIYTIFMLDAQKVIKN